MISFHLDCVQAHRNVRRTLYGVAMMGICGPRWDFDQKDEPPPGSNSSSDGGNVSRSPDHVWHTGKSTGCCGYGKYFFGASSSSPSSSLHLSVFTISASLDHAFTRG